MRLFSNITRARFIERPNRFVVVCDAGTGPMRAFLPNPGRLLELLLPGAWLYIEESSNPARKLRYTVVAVERLGRPVILHTHRANDIAEWLVGEGVVPGLAGAEVVAREVTVGRSRFDLLLRKDGEELLTEVKSCTLFGEKAAMFPDAVTVRGRRHIKELAGLSTGRTRGAVIFIVYNPDARYFLPDYHTDLEFSRTLIAARDRVEVLPLAVTVDEGLEVRPEARVLSIPWEVLEREARDGGSYLVVLRLAGKEAVRVGGLGTVVFRPGYYVYVGSAKTNLTKRVERHKRFRKRLRWHIDYLRAVSTVHAVLPVRTTDDVECGLARAVAGLSDGEAPGFGSSDCRCKSHLFHFDSDPLRNPAFHSILGYYRMDRLFDRPR